MIQDIYPHRLRNEFIPVRPVDPEGLLFCFDGDSVLCGIDNGDVALPRVKDFPSDAERYINIGTPTRNLQAQYGTDSRIQLNDSFKTVDEIRDFIAAERDAMSEADRSFMTVAIKADETTRMGIVTDVKQELRKCSALKIMYTARKPAEN